MEKLKILVVEDEIIIADNICYTLEELGYEVLEPAINYSEAIEMIESEKPDLAMLDINLSGKKTGIEIAQRIEDEFNFPFIFLTSNTDKATIHEAKKVMPSAYLVKPFTKDELYSAVEIALYKHEQDSNSLRPDDTIVKDALFIKDKGALHKVLFSDILYLKSDHVYLEIVQKEKKDLIVRGSLNRILEKLPEYFIRVHRGYIINTSYLNQIDGFSLKVGNECIPIGKSFHAELLRKINCV